MDAPPHAARVNDFGHRSLCSVMTALSAPALLAAPLELVARTRAGDESAFAGLVDRYRPIVFRWAIALAGDEDDAEDITQEVFVRVYRKLWTFRGDGSFEAWLYRITRRVVFHMRPATPAPAEGVI